MKCKLCTNLFHKYTQQGGYENNVWYCNLCIHDQPERLNPEDIRNNVCDSPTLENK
jgi:hypothetical protein